MTAPDAVSKAPYQKIGSFCFMQKSMINSKDIITSFDNSRFVR